MFQRLRASMVAISVALAAGCVAYPAPYYAYSAPVTYDRAWNAALGALDDALALPLIRRNGVLQPGWED